MKHKCEKCKDTGWIYGCYTVIKPDGYDVAEDYYYGDGQVDLFEMI